MPRQYRLMSADGHLEVPPERWVHRVPEKYRDRAPHTVNLPDGGDALMIEGQPLLGSQFSRSARRPRRPGPGSPSASRSPTPPAPAARSSASSEQDQDGMDAEVLFAAMVAGPVFWRNIAHDEVYKAVIRGYNDWLGEEYCAVAPDRLIGMGVIPITNVDDAIAEMEHCKKLGLKGVLLGALPNAQRLSDAGGRPILGRRARSRHAGHGACPALPHRRRAPTSRPSNTRKKTRKSWRGCAGRSSNGCAISDCRRRSASRSWCWPACSSAIRSSRSSSPRPASAGSRSGSNTWISGTSATWLGQEYSASSR